MRIETLGQMVALEVAELEKLDQQKKLANNKVSLNRLSTLHFRLNTLIEKAIANKKRV
jgi:hypothetical protein